MAHCVSAENISDTAILTLCNTKDVRSNYLRLLMLFLLLIEVLCSMWVWNVICHSRYLVLKHYGETLLAKPKRRWNNNIKMYLTN